ncbi:cytochrome P450 20A1-like [Ptychodera flava]|uniref:cytochrome P450 20A1-like n=1 Tax=Ptychodera flava TaxID=63121 RepID=UPI00396A8266
MRSENKMANVAVLVAVVIVVISILYQCLRPIFRAPSSKDGVKVAKAEDKWTTAKKIPGMEKRHSEDGNLQDITEAGGFVDFLFKLHAKYGYVASFWYGKHYYVSLASPQAWKDHIKVFDRPVELFEFSRPLIGDNCLQTANGKEGKTRRKIYDVSFQNDALQNYYKDVQEVADDTVEKLSSIPSGENISLQQHVPLYVSMAFGRVFYGDFFKDEEKVIALRDNYETTMEALNQKISDVGPANEEKFNTALNTWRGIVQEAIQHRRDNPPLREEDRNFLDVLIDFCVTDELLFTDAAIFYIGGYHTTTYMIVWMIYFMARDIKVQDKVHEELVEVLGNERNVNLKNQSQLRYLKRVIDETIRCSVLAPFAARVNFEEDMKVLDYTIPKGTGVIHALGVVLADKAIWPDPERFDPDRFLPEKVAERHKLAFSPFGFAGKRICPAYRVSHAEAFVLLATLCRKFKFHLVGGQNIKRKYGFVTLPSEEVKITLEKRE